ALFAIRSVLTIPVDLIGQNLLWVHPEAFLIRLYRFDQGDAFVEVVPLPTLQESKPLHHTDGHLRPKFDFRFGFPSNNRSNVWLVDVDNPIFYLVHSLCIHHVLLAIQLLNDKQLFILPPAERCERSDRCQFFDDAKITLEESKLLTDPSTQGSVPDPTLLRESQVRTARFFPIRAWFRAMTHMRLVQRIDDRFQLLAGFVQ